MPKSDRLAIVTGASSGIGHAVASLLLDRGWDVVGLSRREPDFHDGGYRHVQLDLSDVGGLVNEFEKNVAGLVADEDRARIGLVNNAAVTGRLGTIEGTDAEEALRTYAINVVAPIWLMGFVARHARLGSALRIVNVSSGAAKNPNPGMTEYTSSKAALRMATLNAATDFGSEPLKGHMTPDVAVLSYEPGTVDTGMQVDARSVSADVFPSAPMFQRFHQEGMLVPPERPAGEMVAFLESEDPPRMEERRLGED